MGIEISYTARTTLRDMERASQFTFEAGVTAMFAYMDAVPGGTDSRQLMTVLKGGMNHADRVRTFFTDQESGRELLAVTRSSKPARHMATSRLQAVGAGFNLLYAAEVAKRVPHMADEKLRKAYLHMIIGAHSLDLTVDDDTGEVLRAARQKSGYHLESIKYRARLAFAVQNTMDEDVMSAVRRSLG